jgi:hypothetical protein
MEKMKALVFHGVNDIRVDEVPRPHAGVGEAVIRTTLTTICGTDLHIVRGEYPVKPGLIIGHEPVGVIEELGRASQVSRSATVRWSERSRPAASAAPAFPGNCPNAVTERAMKLSAAGALVIRLTAHRRNICSCRTPRRIWRRYRTN